MKLDIKQNALHTLYHAIEHLAWAEEPTDSTDERSFDEDSHCVEWLNQEGQQSFVCPEFTLPPAGYGRKFALLHLIQAVELILKAYVEEKDPDALFKRKNPDRTIRLDEALKFTVGFNPDLLSPDELALLLQAKDIRNKIEHYQIHYSDDILRQLCIDFLAICSYLTQHLLSISLLEAFSWDYLRDSQSSVGDFLPSLLGEVSDLGRQTTAKTGLRWASENLSERMFLCLNCGARTVSADQGTCMGCGIVSDERASQLVEELEQITSIYIRARDLMNRGK